MPLWKLQPLDVSDPNWEASSHRGLVIIRAPDEEAARDEAQRAFGVKTRFSPGAGVKAPPWTRASLVAAERIRDERYEEDGPTEILVPSFTPPSTSSRVGGRRPCASARMPRDIAAEG